MKILLVGGYSGFMSALSATSGVEVFSVASPEQCAAALDNGERNIYPYRCGSKVSWTSRSYLRHAISDCRPDIVHAFYGNQLAHSIMAIGGMRNPPGIVSFRGVTRKLSRLDPGDWISYLHPRVAGHACESNAIRESLIASGESPDKCVVTYGCYSPPPFPDEERPDLREFGIPEGSFVVGTVATMRRVKGIDLLLEAAIQCAPFMKDTYWLLIGPIIDKRVAALANDPRIRDRVILTGRRSDPVDLIRRADLFVMPSRAEGLCKALLESMSVGVCPIVSDAGGMKEVVRHGVDGLVTPSGNVAALAEAICSLQQNPVQRAAFGSSARERIADFCSAAMMAERAMTLYRRVIA